MSSRWRWKHGPQIWRELVNHGFCFPLQHRSPEGHLSVFPMQMSALFEDSTPQSAPWAISQEITLATIRDLIYRVSKTSPCTTIGEWSTVPVYIFCQSSEAYNNVLSASWMQATSEQEAGALTYDDMLTTYDDGHAGSFCLKQARFTQGWLEALAYITWLSDSSRSFDSLFELRLNYVMLPRYIQTELPSCRVKIVR